MPQSIFNNFKGLHKDGKPLDFLATWKKTFDKASERNVALFQKTFTDNWFTYGTPQMSLTAEGLVGKYNMRFMATLIGNESPTPLRRTDGFDIWTKEIPRVGHKFMMHARDLRRIQEIYENPRLTEASKVREIEKTLTGQMKDAYLGCKDVMDFIVLNSWSNFGVTRFVPDLNNPGGREFEIDYQMPEVNKLISAHTFTSANTKAGKVVPVLVLAELMSDLRSKGIEPGELLMDQTLYSWLRMDATTRLLVHGNDKQAQVVTKTEFDSLLSENEIPTITVINRKMAISADGKLSTITPYNPNCIVIKPKGVVGEIQPAVEDNEILEEAGVTYMNAGNGIRIAKWTTGESTNQVAAEYTQGSGRLIPVVEEIGQIVCFQVRGFEEKDVPVDAQGNEREYWTKAEYDGDTSLVEG